LLGIITKQEREQSLMDCDHWVVALFFRAPGQILAES